jgi:hypothetical protein
MNKNILVASYYFPPHPGVGGRRMAKFCKYLAKKGYTIHVIKVEDHYIKRSNWIDDITDPNIKVYSLPICYPKILMMEYDRLPKKQTLLKRLFYKMTFSYYKLIQKKRIFDLTFLWEKQFVELGKELIEKFNITNVIVSVSPHYYAFYATKLKDIFPNLNLIIDFRDPWMTMPDFGMQSMNRKQKSNEMKIISKVVKSADYLISPSMFALEEFKTYDQKGIGLIEIPHAFDEDDILPYLKSFGNENRERVKVIYPGTLYTGILPNLQKLNDVLEDMKRTDLPLYSKLQIDFFVDQLDYKDHFGNHECVNFYPSVGKLIFKKIAESDIILILYTEFSKNFRTTKFYEFLPFQKQYLYIGPPGDTYNFIKENKLGYSLGQAEDTKLVLEFFSKIARGNKNDTPLINFRSYSFDKQTDELIKLFK